MGTRGIVAVLLVLLVGAGVAGIAYNAGVARGIAGSGQVAPPPPGVAPYPYYGPYWHGPFGFGFFGFLFPLLFFFLIFALLKGLFWGHRWGGYYGRWGGGVPPMFEEWHRRAHEEKRDTGTA